MASKYNLTQLKVSRHFSILKFDSTCKSLSEALLFAEHGEKMLCPKIVLNVRNNFFTQHVLPRFQLGIFIYWTCNWMNNLSSYCGLVYFKLRASDKDLPIQILFFRIQYGVKQVVNFKSLQTPSAALRVVFWSARGQNKSMCVRLIWTNFGHFSKHFLR